MDDFNAPLFNENEPVFFGVENGKPTLTQIQFNEYGMPMSAITIGPTQTGNSMQKFFQYERCGHLDCPPDSDHIVSVYEFSLS